jgi:predicted acyltransferase
MSTTTATPAASQRLLSLDVFRGLTILGMILVNNPGSWSHMYWPLGHADWHGWTPTDLIFPFFLFIVGTSLAYSLRKYRDGATISSAVYWRIVRRTATLFLLGLGLGLFGKLCGIWFGGEDSLHLDELRIPGVLQRIALVYFAASMIALYASRRVQAVIAAVLLLGYWALLAWLPPAQSPAARLSPKGNVVRVVDRALLNDGHLYTKATSAPTDPEGLLSTLPAIVTAILGYWTGLAIQRRGCNWRTVALLFVGGLAIAVAGLAWHETLPINKKLWTSSFVLLTGGLAISSLAVCLAVFDVAGMRRLGRPFEIVGVNAIFVFVGSSLLARLLASTHVGEQTTKDWLYQKLFTDHIADAKLASLSFALATIACWWIVLWVMARRGWSVRV